MPDPDYIDPAPTGYRGEGIVLCLICNTPTREHPIGPCDQLDPGDRLTMKARVRGLRKEDQQRHRETWWCERLQTAADPTPKCGPGEPCQGQRNCHWVKLKVSQNV